MNLRRGTAWAACVVMFCATAGALAPVALAQSTRPTTAPAMTGVFDKQPLERSAGAAPVRKDLAAVKPVPPSTGLDTLRVVAALALVIVVILLLRWIAQQFFGMPTAKKASRAVQVLSRSMISPKQQVLLLQVGRRVIVVADTGGQMNPLAVITDPDEIAALAGQLQSEKSTPAARSFGSIFGRAQTKFDAADEPSPERQPVDDDLDPALATTQAELTGLMEKVRSVAQGIKRN